MFKKIDRSPPFFLVFTHVVNFYLPQRSDANAWKPSPKDTPVDSPGQQDTATIASVAGSGSDETTLRTLEGDVLEALREFLFFIEFPTVPSLSKPYF